MKELVTIQTELVATKAQFNKFGNYYYRSCEDILESLKPLIKKTNCNVTITDSVEFIGNRYYIKAVATITNAEGESVSAVGYAREEDSKKGMDAAQLTGATSSYARKYALNGLFCIDDNKDIDVEAGAPQQGKGKQPAKAVTPPFPPQQPSAQQPQGDALLNEATSRVMSATTLEVLTQVFNTYSPKLTEEQRKRFTQLCSSRRKQIESNGAK
jgi:hypothetical protein